MAAEETAGACEPVVARGVLVAADDEILSHRVFTACLSQCEIVVDSEILVQRHVVVQILVAGDARHNEVVEGLANRQTVNNRCAAVETRVVIGNLASFNPLIGVTALTARRDRRHIGHVPAVLVAPLEFGSGAEHAFPVTAAAIELVGELATGRIVLSRQRQTQVLLEQGVVACPHAPRAVVGTLDDSACALVVERRQGIDVHQTAQGVAAVQGVLWPAHHLHAGDIHQVKVVILLGHHGHVVDSQTHCGLVDACADAADIDC